MDFSLSKHAKIIYDSTLQFIDEQIKPIEEDYYRELHAGPSPWVVLPIVEKLKAAAREQGLWNLFYPDDQYGRGLNNLEYAYVAEATGQSFIAPEIFNCNAPDTGNMEVLIKYGTVEQKERFLSPLLEGKTRSAFGMTEPDVASSDATNMQATAVADADEIIINGRKWWTTGIGHPNCEFIIFMGRSLPDAPRHQQHSMVLVPLKTPGVKVERMLDVFNDYDAPYGHGEVSFTDVRVPKENVILGLGRGFEIAQGRLGPGRVHHCMRAIGAAERALKLMVERAKSRVAFGKPLSHLGGNMERIADARMALEQARLLTLKAAWSIDRDHNQQGKLSGDSISLVSQIKVVVPNMLQTLVDEAIQLYGGEGLCQDAALAALFGYARVLRIADGPDAVHRAVVAKQELKAHD